jgi:hypothetical protein
MEGIEMLGKLIYYKENDFESYERNDESNYMIPYEIYYFERKYVEVFVRDTKEKLYKLKKLYRKEVEDFRERVLSLSETNIEDIRDTFERISNADIYIYGGQIIKNKMLLKELKRTTGIC